MLSFRDKMNTSRYINPDILLSKANTRNCIDSVEWHSMMASCEHKLTHILSRGSYKLSCRI